MTLLQSNHGNFKDLCELLLEFLIFVIFLRNIPETQETYLDIDPFMHDILDEGLDIWIVTLSELNVLCVYISYDIVDTLDGSAWSSRQAEDTTVMMTTIQLVDERDIGIFALRLVNLIEDDAHDRGEWEERVIHIVIHHLEHNTDREQQVLVE